MKKQFESLKADKFARLDIGQYQHIRGGIKYSNTSGTGTVQSGGKSYDYNGDVKELSDNGTLISTGYWVPSLVKYIWVDAAK